MIFRWGNDLEEQNTEEKQCSRQKKLSRQFRLIRRVSRNETHHLFEFERRQFTSSSQSCSFVFHLGMSRTFWLLLNLINKTRPFSSAKLRKFIYLRKIDCWLSSTVTHRHGFMSTTKRGNQKNKYKIPILSIICFN